MLRNACYDAKLSYFFLLKKDFIFFFNIKYFFPFFI